jgi:DNA (cytosine-5)-methyltransferase 1
MEEIKFWQAPTMADVHEGEEKNLFTHVSLFAGLGGSSTGMRLAGAHTLGISEFIDYRNDIYGRNYPKCQIWNEDIRELSGDEILRRIGLKKGELDLLDGSPPCSDFSTNNMGKREKQWGNEKKYSNKRQRVDDLFYEFARVLKEVQPKVFVAENVKGLTVGNAKTILGDRSKSLSSLMDIEEEDEVSDLTKFNGKDETIVETLRACGYKVSYQVMNCAHYGIPQIRERLIFIGIRNDLPYSPSFPKPFTKTKQIIGKDAIGNFLFNGGNVVLNPETMTYRYVKEYFPPHTTKLQVLNKMKDEKFGTYAHRYHRDNWDKVFYTIVAQDGNNVIHSLVDRYFSVCEAKKIQGFPDDFNDGLPPFKRIKVSASDLINPDFYSKLNYKWKDQGHACGDVKNLIELGRWKWDDMKDQKIFDLDLETEYDKTQKYLHSSKSWENLGRAVPPLLYKAVGEHIYENVLKHLK